MDRNPSGKKITEFTKRSPTPREATPQLRSEQEALAENSAEEYGLAAGVERGDLPVAMQRRAPSLPPYLDRRKSRLALMPLTVLLPELGEAGNLHSYRQHISNRLLALGAFEGTEDRHREHTAEEVMLNQIVKWLSLGRE